VSRVLARGMELGFAVGTGLRDREQKNLLSQGTIFVCEIMTWVYPISSFLDCLIAIKVDANKA